MLTIFNETTKFLTGTFKPIILSDIVNRVEEYMNDGYEHDIVIGTDSQRGKSKVKFVTAIAIHKIGKGGIFFYHSMMSDYIHNLSDRIYMETTMSINCATELLDIFMENDMIPDIKIHCDVGQDGATRDLIQGIVGYVTAAGFECEIKPQATVAACIADRFSK
jgi:predicted RNase H-related nuclease YkuK (DUF458 family)